MRIKYIFAWIAAFLSMPIFTSPGIQFLNVFRKRINYEETPTFLIGTIYCNCLAWYAYGDLIFSKPLITCSFLGLCFTSLYIIIYLFYEIKKYLFDVILNIIIIFSGTGAVYRTLTIILPDTAIVGKVCVLTSLISLMHPLYLICKVFKEKNYKLISLMVSQFTILSSIFWIIYGFLEWDFYIVCPNIFNVFVAIIQIFVRKNYKVRYSTIEQAGTSTIEIEIETMGDDDISKKKDNNNVNIDDENVEEGGKMISKPVKIASKKEFQETTI